MRLYLWFSADPVVAKYRELVRFYSSRKEVKAFLTSFGPYAPVPFIILQALQVVFAPIPGEATGFLGGYVFGTWLGFLYSSIGLTLGSAAAFGLGRWLGAHVVRRLVSDAVYHKFDFVARTGGELVTLLFFLIPGFPKDYLCFLLGVSPMPFGIFLIIIDVRADAGHLAPLDPGGQGARRALSGVRDLSHRCGHGRPAGVHLPGDDPGVAASASRRADQAGCASGDAAPAVR